MFKTKLVILTIVVFIISTSAARADDLRCDAPPFGSEMAKFKSFVLNYTKYVFTSAEYLKKICNAKFSNFDREPFYALGFSDQLIESTDTVELGIKFLETTLRIHRQVRAPFEYR